MGSAKPGDMRFASFGQDASNATISATPAIVGDGRSLLVSAVTRPAFCSRSFRMEKSSSSAAADASPPMGR
jgi:hypothetical protein